MLPPVGRNDNAGVMLQLVGGNPTNTRSIRLSEMGLDGRKTHVIAIHIDTFYELARDKLQNISRVELETGLKIDAKRRVNFLHPESDTDRFRRGHYGRYHQETAAVLRAEENSSLLTEDEGVDVLEEEHMDTVSKQHASLTKVEQEESPALQDVMMTRSHMHLPGLEAVEALALLLLELADKSDHHLVSAKLRGRIVKATGAIWTIRRLPALSKSTSPDGATPCLEGA
uniref:Uncharacterized protein n=1 Tax=Branchiostoma floridae TaxID=7739 RepID=C3ZUK0_BRAFL|eukprot:XP_002587701.1 hypothetical protein BRAFLDRAFT_127391 [Branchiostoma floridae]